jgi:hypothetical protein
MGRIIVGGIVNFLLRILLRNDKVTAEAFRSIR